MCLLSNTIKLSINGFSPGSASPFFVLGETTRMGEKTLQEAAFNHQVDLKNEEYRARSIDSSLGAQIDSAKYNARAAGFRMFSNALSMGLRGYSIYTAARRTGGLGGLTFGDGFGLSNLAG